MPQYSWGGLPGEGLQEHLAAERGFIHRGPCVSVQIHVPDALARQLRAKCREIPRPIPGTALIDTGASISCIDDVHREALGLAVVSRSMCYTPHDNREQDVYAARLEFPGTPLPAVPTMFVLANRLRNQGIDVLIGRDYLVNKTFVINGPLVNYTIYF